MLQKCENFCKATDRLTEALADLAVSPASTVIRDGVIQRFEFTFELAWKSLREYMADNGADMSNVVFSKQTFKAAYAAHLIDDEQVWLDMLDARNITSHVYDDAQADRIAKDIRDRYIGSFAALVKIYKTE